MVFGVAFFEPTGLETTGFETTAEVDAFFCGPAFGRLLRAAFFGAGFFGAGFFGAGFFGAGFFGDAALLTLFFGAGRLVAEDSVTLPLAAVRVRRADGGLAGFFDCDVRPVDFFVDCRLAVLDRAVRPARPDVVVPMSGNIGISRAFP